MRDFPFDALAVPATLVATLSFAAQLAASEPVFPRRYEIVTETGMPHLEENLRYATTRKTACLSALDPASSFPILRHQALAGCALDHPTRREDVVSYALTCTGGHGTTGEAVWRIDADRIDGILHVKLGGKNMTFYQHVVATAIGECNGAEASTLMRDNASDVRDREPHALK